MEKVKTEEGATLKKAIGLFWRGLTGMVAGVTDGIATLLGMRDESRYGKVIRRVAGSCFAIVMALMALAALRTTVEDVLRDFGWREKHVKRELPGGMVYFQGLYGATGYVENQKGERTAEGIEWLYKPNGDDSLACYSDGKKRGYLNLFTGEVVVEPKYAHAWVFSEGLAAVDDDGWIKFIDPTGKVVTDPQIPYAHDMEGIAFHDGYCVVRDKRQNRMGVINKRGEWVLQPEYVNILLADSLWIVRKGREESVLTKELESVMPFSKARHWIEDGVIFATMPDHSLRKYDLTGKLLDDFCIKGVEKLVYPTDELQYGMKETYSNEGDVMSEIDYRSISHVPETARCMRYEAEGRWYGLLSPNGRVVTPPSYTSIEAIGPDYYLCRTGKFGVILNGKGERCVPIWR